MNITQTAVEQLNTIYSQIQKRFENIKKQLSNIDTQIQDILHFLEFSSFNAAEGYFLAKFMKELRLQRREIKNEFELLQSIMPTVEKNLNDIKKLRVKADKRIQDQVRKKYSPRIINFNDIHSLINTKCTHF